MSLSEINDPAAIIPPGLTAPQNAVIYCRVSSPRQVEDGHGLKSQEARCRDYAVRMGYRVLEAFHEKGVSSSVFDRPEFIRMVEFLFTRQAKDRWPLLITLTLQ